KCTARKVTETDNGGEISQVGLVHVVAVLLAWTPRPLSARTLSGIGFRVRVTFPPMGPGAPIKPWATSVRHSKVNVSLMPHTLPTPKTGPHAGVGVKLPKLKSPKQMAPPSLRR